MLKRDFIICSFNVDIVTKLHIRVLNSLPYDKILDVTKLKAFADNKLTLLI